MRDKLTKLLESKPYVGQMLDTLSRQAGRDAVEVACQWYPEFADTDPEWKAEVFTKIHDIMKVKGEPFTPENARHAAQFFITNLECDQAAFAEANPQNPAAFKPKPEEVEADFFQNAPADAIGRYLQHKYGQR